MRRALMLCAAAVCVLPIAASADAVIYRCIGAHGLVYQDTPCPGAKDSQNRVLVTGEIASSSPRSVPPRNDTSLRQFAQRTGRDNRIREAAAHVKALEQRNRADEAEFAAMIADVEQKQQAADALVADTPPRYQLDATRAELQQNYVEKAQQNQAELNLAREALQAEQER